MDGFGARNRSDSYNNLYSIALKYMGIRVFDYSEIPFTLELYPVDADL